MHLKTKDSLKPTLQVVKAKPKYQKRQKSAINRTSLPQSKSKILTAPSSEGAFLSDVKYYDKLLFRCVLVNAKGFPLVGKLAP